MYDDEQVNSLAVLSVIPFTGIFFNFTSPNLLFFLYFPNYCCNFNIY